MECISIGPAYIRGRVGRVQGSGGWEGRELRWVLAKAKTKKQDDTNGRV